MPEGSTLKKLAEGIEDASRRFGMEAGIR